MSSREHLEYCRDRLLARIPVELLKTDEAKSLREAMEKAGEMPENEPLVSPPEFSWESVSEEDWLTTQGVDTKLPENQELQELLMPLERFTSTSRNGSPASEAIMSVLPSARNLYTVLCHVPKAEKKILDLAWTKLASCAETMSRAARGLGEEEFQFCREALLACARHDLPEPNPELDSKYSSPAYSSFPRTEAAVGLPRLVARQADSEMLDAIEALIHDSVPSVRFLVMGELSRIAQSSSEVFWRLAEDIAEHETNQVVQRALCWVLERMVPIDEEKTTEVLAKLFKRAFSPDEDSDLLNSLVDLVMGLSLGRDNEWAAEKADSFLSEPVRLAKPLRRAAFNILTDVAVESLSSTEYHELTQRIINWLSQAIDASAEGIRELLQAAGERDREIESKLRDLYGVMDQVVIHLYQRIKTATGQKSIKDEQIEDFHSAIKPLLAQILEFALDKENGVMFAPTAHNFMQLLNAALKYDPRGVLHMAAGVAKSSMATGYTTDPLAVREVVELVEAILANYRREALEGESLQDLLNLLDIFAEAGWPEALNLVWRLDEIFR